MKGNQMKNLTLSFAFLALSGFILGACGDATQGNGDDDCEKAAEVAQEAMDTACEHKDDTCCICKCWKEGQDYDPIPVDCTCVSFDPPETCEGNVLQEAQDCLADESACQLEIRNVVEGLCPVS